MKKLLIGAVLATFTVGSAFAADVCLQGVGGNLFEQVADQSVQIVLGVGRLVACRIVAAV